MQASARGGGEGEEARAAVAGPGDSPGDSLGLWS